MHRILVADKLGDEGLNILATSAEVEFDVATGLTESELTEAIRPYHALIVRSATRVSEAVLGAGAHLKVVGRAGIGVDNIDVAAATMRGVIVMNTPQANSVATAEQTFALMLAAARNTAAAHSSLAGGAWDRSGFAGIELNRKKLGIVGFGRIGRLVAQRAQAFGMEVLAYDPYVSEEVARDLKVTLVNLDELLAQADFVTLHTPNSPETENLINADTIAGMKPGVIIINAARGQLIDEDALLAALDSGRVRAAGLDVYRTEPPGADNRLVGHPRVVHTPHLGAATEEAQRDVASQIAEQVIDALNGRSIRNAVNLPFGAERDFQTALPFMALAEKLGLLQAAMAPAPIRSVELEVKVDDADALARPVAAGLLAGILRDRVEDVNYVNAPVLAQSQGLSIAQAKDLADRDYPNLISCRVHWDGGQRDISGVLFGGVEPRIVQVSHYHLDVNPTGLLLIMLNKDVPGVIGMVGTTLGRYGVNIAEWRLGRNTPGTEALSFINLDNAPPPEALDSLRDEAAILKLMLIDL